MLLDEVVTVALHGRGDGDVSGVALLSPHAADPSPADVVVFLVELRP